MSIPLRHKKALIIGLNYTNKGLWTLKGAQNDARATRSLLQDTYMFAEHEMVVMSDYEGIENSLLPTRSNIIHQLNTFVMEKNEDTDYVFIYAGHTDQFPDTGPSMHQEEDGKAECIVPLDAISPDADIPDKTKVIFDFELHEYMIKRLGLGCRLTAIADSCHSATLLNVIVLSVTPQPLMEPDMLFVDLYVTPWKSQ
ncbi:hypothetical protein D9619_009295 [Psilocybe cf. subviscida]|uniref:Peptidase C14 caspase domain-containing protein n=1 Tax=Psilocybe cf. subviscida TaxID=2480587 RepID=A0A8H5BUG6_9AGAR|nr:hypothetical protein D9619_009295 [Psilocybe cf. subviscida]